MNRLKIPLLIAILLGALAVARIVSTYAVVSPTYDEPAHIAAGIELLAQGTSTYEQKHPPLARVAVALGPYSRAPGRMANAISSPRATASCTMLERTRTR
jgi:hypothetical protein